MTLRFAFAVGVAALGLPMGGVSVGPAPALAAEDLTIAVPKGPLQEVLSDAFAAAFAKASGATLRLLPTDGSVAAARAAHADVAVLEAQALAAGCKDGSLAKLDWTALGGRDREVAGAASDCGEGAVLRSVVLAWNRDKFPGQPTWAEFWDVAKVPGKRGLRRSARGNLELALVADGVAPADIYSTLRTDAGVQRAFRKLDQLKPYLVWWSADAEAPKLLESGEVLMTSAPAEGIIAAQRGQGGPAYPAFSVQWAGGLTSVDSFAVLAGSAHAALAAKFLVFAADPKNQRGLPALGGYGGSATAANDGLPPAQLALSPSAPANLAAGIMIDEAFWQQNGAKLSAQFEAWLTK